VHAEYSEESSQRSTVRTVAAALAAVVIAMAIRMLTRFFSSEVLLHHVLSSTLTNDDSLENRTDVSVVLLLFATPPG
jgi:hypothetical protein